MNNLLIPFYNNLPNINTPYFTLTSSKLIISLQDVFGNLSNFLTQLSNKTIYIYNGQNMGTIIINSLLFSSNSIYTLSINVNYMPSIKDGDLCVLSLQDPSDYLIDRIFTSSMNNLNNNGYFTINNNNITINTKSPSKDDTLFLYILATNTSFNIIDNDSNMLFLITDLQININNSTNNYLEYNARTPSLQLIEGYEYSISLIDDNNINSPTPSIVNIDNSKNINFQSTKILYDSVLLSYTTNNNYISNGSFTLQNIDTSPNKLEHFSLSNVWEDTKKTTLSLTDTWTKTINTGFSKIGKYTQNSAIQYSKNTIKPDLLNNIPIITGNNYTLSLSNVGLFNIPIDPLKQYSLMYLSKGTTTTLLSINTDPVYKIDSMSKTNEVIECNVLYNDNISNLLNLSSYVLSSTPIRPLVVYNYLPTYNISNIIDKGNFTILSIDGNHSNPTMVISNYEILHNNNISSFTNLLYTISQDPVQCLNILNFSDYSQICSLSILNVVPDANQTTITYTIKSGASNLNKLSTYSRYIFSLYSGTDFTSDNSTNLAGMSIYNLTGMSMTNQGILNITRSMDTKLTNTNNLIQSAYDYIKTSYTNKPNDSNLIIANNIISNVSMQSNIILNMQVTSIIPTILDALITNTYNALLYALLYDPGNPSFNLLITKINNMSTKTIQIAILNNASLNIHNAMKQSPNIYSIPHVNDQLNIIIMDMQNNNSINTATIQNLISTIDSIISSNSNQTQTIFYLIKTQKILQLLITPGAPETMQNVTNYISATLNKRKIIENLDNVVQDNSYYQFIFSMIIFAILIGFLINNSRK